jgi:hypothetical protein
MMPVEAPVEKRLPALEDAAAELRLRLPSSLPNSNWLERVIGSFKDEPAFDEVLAYGRALRAADRPPPEVAP